MESADCSMQSGLTLIFFFLTVRTDYGTNRILDEQAGNH